MRTFLRHLFLPHHTNNQRPRILHHISIICLIVAIIGVSTISLLGKKNHSAVLGVSYSISDTEMLQEVNAQRARENLPPLVMNDQLKEAAAGKAANMFQNNYWAHFGPDGTTPWQFIRGAGYDYIDAGENLAKGFTNSHDVVTAWMNSPTHRENIMSPKYHDIGFAIVPGNLQGEDTVLVVQMFGSRAESQPAQVEVEPQAAQVVVQTINPASGSALAERVISLTPTPIVITGQSQSTPLVMSSNSQISNKPLVNIDSFSKSMLLVIFLTLLIVFVLDLLIIERRKIPRVVGHNLDHIILIALFILFILLFKSGFVM
jgi:hypothetical protein